MADIDWKEFGRRLAESTTIRSATSAADWLTEDPTPYVRGCFLDLLAAARWGADNAARRNLRQRGGTVSPGHCAHEAEGEALRLLTDGFRERLAEIAGQREGADGR